MNSSDKAIANIANLLRHYGFDLGHSTAEQLLADWLKTYSINWVRLAIVEALYQGRYKAISVGQILVLWQRRGQPLYHFNHEFERLICDQFPRDLLSPDSNQEDRKRPTAIDPGLLYDQVPFQPELNSTPEAALPETPENAAAIAETPPTSTELSPLTESSQPDTDQSLDAILSTDGIQNTDAILNTDAIAQSPQTDLSFSTKTELLSHPEVLLPCLGLSDPSLKPNLKLHLSHLYQPNWLISTASKYPIHQFTPVFETSDFYSKLQSVAKPGVAE